MRYKHKLLILGITGLAVGLVAWPAGGSAEPVAAPDPATIPLPAFDNDDPAKSVVARVRFDSRTAARVESTAVSLERAHSHLGDPPILRLSLRDADGAELDRLNAWSPLWTFRAGNDHHMTVAESGSGSFIVPFSPTLSSMVITDVALNQPVLTVDLAAPIRDFCATHPADPDCRESDLSVDAVEPVAPLFAVLGQPVTVTVATTVANAGPDGPTAARVVRTAVAGEGLTVSPADPATTDVDLAVGAPQRLTRTYTVTCTRPGTGTVDFGASVAPKLPTVVDPRSDNNARTTRASVTCAVPVAVNIKPGSADNVVNLDPGVVPLAVLSTKAGEYGLPVAIDATRIDPASLRFGPPPVLQAGAGGPESHGAVHREDVAELDETTHDGDADAMLHFRIDQSGMVLRDTTGCVYGRLAGPTGWVAFYGCDRIAVLP